MKGLVAAAALALLSSAAPASAGTWRYEGSVAVTTITPTIARQVYAARQSNDRITGDVFRLPASADGKTYTLTLTAGASGRENPDAFFYMAGQDDQPGDLCTVDAYDQGPAKETGTICPKTGERAAWAIVILREGARAGFTFSYKE